VRPCPTVGDVAPADPRIADARPPLDPWLDHIAHGPDAHGFARPCDLELAVAMRGSWRTAAAPASRSVSWPAS